MGLMTLILESFTDNHKEVLWVPFIYGWEDNLLCPLEDKEVCPMIPEV